MAATAQALCREAPKCKWEKGKCVNQGKGGYARGKVPMDFKDDGENEFAGGPDETGADDSSEPDASEPAGAKLFHEEGGDGEGDGEADEPLRKGPPQKPKPGEDDADGEEEDYETAMKKLTEKAGDL